MGLKAEELHCYRSLNLCKEHLGRHWHKLLGTSLASGDSASAGQFHTLLLSSLWAQLVTVTSPPGMPGLTGTAETEPVQGLRVEF